MRRVVKPAKRVRDGVDIADARAGECNACLKRSKQHLLPRFEIVSIRIRPIETAEDGRRGLLGAAIGLFRCAVNADIGFHCVGERVHTGLRCCVRGEILSERGIEHRIARHKTEIHDRVLVPCFLVRNNGGDRRLRAGAGGRRHGDERRESVHDFEKSRHLFHGAIGAHDARRRSLGRIHRRSAADGKEAVAALGKIHFPHLFDDGDRWIRAHAVKMDGRQARGFDLRADGRYKYRSRMPAGDNHHLFHAAAAQQFRDLCRTARAADDLRLAPRQNARAEVKYVLVGPTAELFHRFHAGHPFLSLPERME